MRRSITVLLAVAAACCVAAPAQARASAPVSDVALPLFPAPSSSTKPPGFAIDAGQAFAIAKTSPKMRAIHRTQHPLTYYVYVMVGSHYEVYFAYHRKLVGDVVVSRDGRLGRTYTGALMLGFYARGNYGDVFDSPFVYLPFGLMFLLPLVFLRGRSVQSWLRRLDIGVVLSFGVSYVLFDTQHLEPAVWLAYPPLVYLLIRMLLRGGRSQAGGGRLDCRLPLGVLAGGLVVLTAARIGLALVPAHVMDVGGASALGAYKILHGQSIYYASLGHPDTYGPVAYLAYVPFEAIWPSSSWLTWLPAVRAATITFDLLTTGGLLLFGMRLVRGREGRRLGLLMAWLWAACPFSLLGVVKNTNDGLIALLVVLIMLTLTTPVRRGILVGLGAAAKFIPAILLPLMAAGCRGGDERHARKVIAGFVIAAGASVAIFLPPGGLKEFYDHTIGFQLTRPDIFSPWALHPGLAPIKDAIEALVAILAVVVAFRPRGARTPAQMSALAAALMIAVELPALHWFYLYIVWFLPLVLIAVVCSDVQPLRPPAGVVEQSTVLAEEESEPLLVGAA